MKFVPKIICKTVGIAGMGLAVYDSAKIAKHFSVTMGEHAQEEFMQDIYYNSRTVEDVSYTSNKVRKATFDMRTRNPLPEIFGKAKGGLQGFLYGMGNQLPLVIASTLAIVGKNVGAKIGAISIGLLGLYKVAREGFGLGKHNPMD